MTDLSRFQGLTSSQIHEELLKCPKSSWPKIISELPSGIKSELVAILSNKRASSVQSGHLSRSETPREAASKKTKLESTSQNSQASSSVSSPVKTENLTIVVHPRCVPLEADTDTETEKTIGVEGGAHDKKAGISSLSSSKSLDKVFQELMVSTFSPISSVVSRTMYIAGDVRPYLKSKDCQELSVRLVQSYLNLWVSLFWNSLINNSSKKKITNKLTNNIIKKHLGRYYKQEVSKFDYDTLVSKSAHRHVGINTTSETGMVQGADTDLTAAISSSVKGSGEEEEEGLNNFDENEAMDYDNSIHLSKMAISIDKRFEDRLKLRDIRTKNMSPEAYKEFAMLREKNFRPSINTLQEWLSITWNTAYNKGLKDTKVSQIPSNSIQLFSFILNDIISSLVENALRISFIQSSRTNGDVQEGSIGSDPEMSFQSCKDLINKVNKLRESIFHHQDFEDFSIQKVDFNLIIDTFSKTENDTPKLNHIHYTIAIIQRLNYIDLKLLDESDLQKSNPQTSPKLDTNLIIEKIYSLNSKLTGQIIRGQQNSFGGSATAHSEKRKRDTIEESPSDADQSANSLSAGFGGVDETDNIMGNEEDDMFEAIIESATSEFPITSAFPNVSLSQPNFPAKNA